MNTTLFAIYMVGTGVDAEAIILEDLFSTKHSIPDYQRKYVWPKKIITKLLQDIENHTKNYPNDVNNNYYVGALMRGPEKNSTSHVSDGQQRLTAIICISSALRDCLLENGEYVEAWELHKKIVHEKLILAKSSEDFGTDSQVNWASKPRTCRLFSGRNTNGRKINPKMKYVPGTPPRLESNIPINLMWDVCEVSFKQTGTMAGPCKLKIKGEPSIQSNSFEIISPHSPITPSDSKFSGCSIFPNNCKVIGKDKNLEVLNGNIVNYNDWKKSDNRAVDTYISSFNFLKKMNKEGRTSLSHYAKTVMNLNFTVSTFESEETAIQYFRVYNNDTTSIPLNPGDEMNAWVIEVTESKFTDPHNNSKKPIIKNIIKNWKIVTDTLRKSGEKDFLPDFLNDYFIASKERISMKKTFVKYQEEYIQPKERSSGFKDGSMVSSQYTWNLNKIKNFISELAKAAKLYRKIVMPKHGDHLASRFRALNSVFKQYQPVMLACLKVSSEVCTPPQSKIANSYGLALFETLYVRGIILPKCLKIGETLRSNTDVYPNITRWSRLIFNASNNREILLALDNIKDEILLCLNDGKRIESFRDTTTNSRISKLEELKILRDTGDANNNESGLILLRLDAWKQGNCTPSNPLKLVFQDITDLTTEHILPQNFGTGWGGFANVSQMEDSVQLIGNLMLLPSTVNSALGNSTFNEKFYSLTKSYTNIKGPNPKNKLLADAIDRCTAGVQWNQNIVKDRSKEMADWLFECFDDGSLSSGRW